jgi:hypothetical protein
MTTQESVWTRKMVVTWTWIYLDGNRGLHSEGSQGKHIGRAATHTLVRGQRDQPCVNMSGVLERKTARPGHIEPIDLSALLCPDSAGCLVWSVRGPGGFGEKDLLLRNLPCQIHTGRPHPGHPWLTVGAVWRWLLYSLHQQAWIWKHTNTNSTQQEDRTEVSLQTALSDQNGLDFREKNSCPHTR